MITGAGGFIGCEFVGKKSVGGYEVTTVSSAFNSSFPDNTIIKGSGNT